MAGTSISTTAPDAHPSHIMTDRRAFLAAAPALALLTAGPAVAHSSPDVLAWEAALQRYETAKRASKAHHDEVYEPAWRRERAFEEAHGVKFGGPGWIEGRDALAAIYGTGHTVSKVISDESERLADLEVEAELALMEMPAPHLSALHWKLNNILVTEDDGYTASWHQDFVQQTMADFRTLLGEA